jgi:predicted PurR-regulated permease PerM
MMARSGEDHMDSQQVEDAKLRDGPGRRAQDGFARRGQATALRNAGVFMAVVVGGFAIKYLHTIITPLVIAVFMMLLIDGFTRTVEKRFPLWPDWLRLSLAAMLIIAGFAAIVGIFAHYGRTFGGQLAVLMPKLDALLFRLCETLQIAPISTDDLLRGGMSATSFPRLFGAARGFLSEAVLVFIYVGFLLASRQAFGRKIDRLFHATGGQTNARRIFGRVRAVSEQYMGLQTLKAALIALVAWIIMSAIGLQNALFMAFVIFLAAYVPIVGGFAGSLLPTLLAFAQFDSPIRAIALLVLLGGAIFLVDNVAMPKLQGDRLNVDPVVILLSLEFWGVILGAPGAVLSTPLTVVVMTIASEFAGARWLALLLSKDGEVASHE